MAKTISPGKMSVADLARRKRELLRQLTVPDGLIHASYVRQRLTCGKPNCRCRRGFKHGPFHYLVQCLRGGRVRKFLLKNPAQRKLARAGVAAHLKLRRKLGELSKINTELLRRNVL